MGVIQRYVLQPDVLTIPVQEVVQALSIGLEHGEICFWAEISMSSDAVETDFAFVSTGESPPQSDWLYLGSAFLTEEVVHVYMRKWGSKNNARN